MTDFVDREADLGSEDEEHEEGDYDEGTGQQASGKQNGGKNRRPAEFDDSSEEDDDDDEEEEARVRSPSAGFMDDGDLGLRPCATGSIFR